MKGNASFAKEKDKLGVFSYLSYRFKNLVRPSTLSKREAELRPFRNEGESQKIVEEVPRSGGEVKRTAHKNGCRPAAHRAG